MAHATVPTAVPVAALVLVLAGGALAWPPEMVRELGVRPDRGDSAAHAYVTGPTYAIRRLHNDDLEISFWKGLSPLTFSLAKNDVWDRRYFAEGKRVITLEDVRRVCFEGELGRGSDLGLPNAPQALYLAYDFPCPKPVGQVIIRCPDLEAPDTWRAGEGVEGTLVVEGARGEARARAWSLLHRTKNLLIIQGEYSGLTQPLQVQLYRHQDTTPQGTSVCALANYGGETGYDYAVDPGNGPLPPPQAGTDGRFFWIRQGFPPEPTFPSGFEYVLMATVSGATAEITAENDVADAGVDAVIHPIDDEVYRKMPGWLKQVRLATERVNSAPSGSLATATIPGPRASFCLLAGVATTRDAADPFSAARQMLLEALAQGPDGIARESLAATDEQIRQWRLSRVMHYNATSCTYADATPWHGDYHFNEGYFTDAIVLDQADSLEQRLRMFEEMLPALRRNAREVYDCGGIAFPLVHYAMKPERVVYANVTWEFGLENTALMLQPFWQIYQYTQDVDFLRDRAYPMMVEGARFYADYVTRGDDGLYHVIPTVSQEHWGFTPKFRLNRDSVGALSFIKYHLRACIEASEALGRDAEERERWRDIADSLAPYPTLDTDEGPVFCDVRDAPRLLNYNITANLVMVLWAEDISLDSPPELLAMARRSLQAIPDPEHSPRKGYLRRIALYLGVPEGVDLSPQGRVLSWPGRIHLYAGVPEGTAVNDSFSGLLAVGGFEVSAGRSGETVRGVRLTSRAGRPCRLKSPWRSGEAKIMDLASREVVPHRMDGDTIVFDTQRDHSYAVLSGPELALADKRFEPREREIGRWSFSAERNGVVRDESGSGHDAELVGGARIAADDGAGALQLDGDGAYARAQRTPAFDFGAMESFSVEARVRLPVGAPPGMVPLVCSMATKQYCLTVSQGRARLYLSSPRGDVFCHATGTTLLADGQWHTVRGVRDVADGTVRIYVDGELEATAVDATTGDFACTAPVTIGAYLWGENTRFARALIDDVTIKSLGGLVDKE